MNGNGQEASPQEYRAAESSSFRACRTCRQRKVKCVPVPGRYLTCEYCKNHNFECQPIEPIAKKRKLNTTTELRARIEQLEAKLESRSEEGNTDGPRGRYDSKEVSQSPSGHLPMYNSPRPLESPLQGQSDVRSSKPRINGSHTNDPVYHYPPPTMRAGHDQHQQQQFMQTLPLPALSPAVQNMLNVGNAEPVGPPRFLRPISDYAGQPQDTMNLQNSSQRHGNSGHQFPNYLPAATPMRPSHECERSLDTSSATRVCMQDTNSEAEGEGNEAQSIRIVGPMAALDEDFYQFFVARGLASRDDRDCEYKDELWTRFFKLSSDPALPIYKFKFKFKSNITPPTNLKPDLPAEAVQQFKSWNQSFGDLLLDTFKNKIASRLYHLNPAQLQSLTNINLDKKPMSMVCASYALAAQCVDAWTIKKRVYLGMLFHQFAMTHLQRDLYPVTTDALNILILLAAFPLQNDTSLLNSWTMALAFDLRLNIDPQHWKIPQEEKEHRRNLFWTIMTGHRWAAVKHLSPTFSHDFFDTAMPTLHTASENMFSHEVELSEIVATITNSFYSVRGAQLLHHNVEGSSAIGYQLEKKVIALKRRVDSYYGFQESGQFSWVGLDVSLSMLRLNLELAMLMIHRPFAESKRLDLIESLEHRQKAAEAATKGVAILQSMPDSHFTELWPTYTFWMLALISFTLLRESVLSEEYSMRRSARDGLVSFMALSRRLADTWFFASFGMQLMSVAKALSGEDYGDVLATEIARPEPVAAMPNNDWMGLGNVDLTDFEWSDFSQLLGLDSSTLGSNWF